jgi:hypothetical protein
LKGAWDNIRNKIGSNSEKGFNNSKFLNGSEVENKPSTPLFFEKDSSRFTKAGFNFSFPFSFPHSVVMNLDENRRRMVHEGGKEMDQSININIGEICT